METIAKIKNFIVDDYVNANINSEYILAVFTLPKVGHERYCGDPIYDEYDDNGCLIVRKIIEDEDKGHDINLNSESSSFAHHPCILDYQKACNVIELKFAPLLSPQIEN